MKSTILSKSILVIVLFCSSHLLVAQHPGVAISTTGAEPDSTAMLDIISSNKGLLIPRVLLTDPLDQLTIPGAAQGLIVYNPTQDFNNFPKGEGIYINVNPNEPQIQFWRKLTFDDQLFNNQWLINGNSGLSNAVNYLGTNDSIDLVMKTKSKEILRLTASGALMAKGDPVNGKIINTGAAGPKMIYSPARDGAFRVGYANTEWNDIAAPLNSNIGSGSVAMGSSRLAVPNLAPIASGANSFAFGYGSRATNTSAIAMGRKDTASAVNSIAIGLNNKADDDNAIAIGDGSWAHNNHAMAIGANDTANGISSISFGARNRANSTESVAIGADNKITGINSFGIGDGSITERSHGMAIGTRVKVMRDYSTAIGYESVVMDGTNDTGDYGTAIGYKDTASGLRALAMGTSTRADAESATAFGNATKAMAIYSTAFGRQSRATAANATAFGYQSLATNSYATAFGYIDTASGQYATAMGARNEASGDFSTATGHQTNATGDYSFSGGWKSTANGTGAAAFGVGTVANGYGTFVVGRYNDPIDNITNCLDPVFIVGIGDGSGGQSNDRQNGLVVDGKGNLFIKGALFVEGNTNINNPDFGNVPMDCTYPSDIRLKTNIESLNGALGKLENIQPITYQFKDQEKYPVGPQIGFSAQELQKEFPQLVKTNESTGFLGVDYQHMSAVTVQAIKEQQEIIQSQDKKLNEQQQKIIELKNDASAQKKINAELNTKNTDLEKRISQLEKLITQK